MNPSSYFARTSTADFVMFSSSHWIALSMIAIFCLLLYSSRFKIRSHSKLKSLIRLLLITILLCSEAGLQIWYLSHDAWKPRSSLPLELCGITLLLSVTMLITRNQLLYSFLYFAGIGGAFIALITPNMDFPYPHIRFLLFFVAHGAIILASLYMTWIEGYKPTWRSLFFTMICLNLVAACVWVANYILGSNYMFLAHKPNTYSVLDYFGPYPYYLLVEELFAFVVFLMMYLMFFWLPDRLKSRDKRLGRV